MKLAILIQITWVAINRLLKIADHAEVSRAWTCRAVAGRRRVLAFGLKPFAGSARRPGDFEQNKKLLRIGILSFIEKNAIILLTNPLHHVWETQQFGRQRDLIVISDRAMSQAELAIIALHFRGQARRAPACPFPQRSKRFAPARGEIFRCRGTRWPWREFIRFAPARQPFERTLWMSRNLNDSIGDRACLSRAGRSNDRKIAVQFASKSLPRCFVG